MRKPASCTLENKDSDQLRSYINAFVFATYIIQSLCFLNINLSKAIFCDCTAWFVSDLVGNPEERFRHNTDFTEQGHMVNRIFCMC